MSTTPQTFNGSSLPRPLIERVRERVDQAAATQGSTDRRERRGAAPRQGSAAGGQGDVRALRRVFREMGRSQRSTRRKTGQAPSPVVREAAQAFREAPSLSALVLVAASLDEVGLLSW
jgi:hypothetical protein